jgi:hypothetical protein
MAELLLAKQPSRSIVRCICCGTAAANPQTILNLPAWRAPPHAHPPVTMQTLCLGRLLLVNPAMLLRL